MKADKHERECARTEEAKYERECARVVRELENDPKSLSLVVRIAESLAKRSRVRRR